MAADLAQVKQEQLLKMQEAFAEQFRNTQERLGKIAAMLSISFSDFMSSASFFYVVALLFACFLLYVPNTSYGGFLAICEMGVTFSAEQALLWTPIKMFTEYWVLQKFQLFVGNTNRFGSCAKYLSLLPC